MSDVRQWVKTLRELVTYSLEKYGLPLPVDPGVCRRWREGLPRGERVLYTSCMYQLAPLVKRAVDLLEKSRAAEGGAAAWLASAGAKYLARFLLKPSRDEEERASAILKNIYRLLERSGVEVGVLEEEPYSGALLYELGFEEEFARHAGEVYRRLKAAGVREVVTVDPHTHYVLSVVYPKYVDGFDLGVVNYLELVKVSRVKISNFVIHDSCLYSRHLDMYHRLREILAPGRPVEDPYVTGRETSGCCGGPVEAVLPSLAKRVALDRLAKLTRLSDKIVVACPICLVNLGGLDLAEVVE